MTDFDRYTKTYGCHGQATIKANDRNKAALFDALAAASVTSVTATFDGEGDSGQIEDVTAFAGDKPVKLPLMAIAIQLAQWGREDLTVRESTLSDAIETLCYGYLEQEHGGWENNDGAYGEFTFDVANRSIALEFHGRYTDTWTDHHSF